MLIWLTAAIVAGILGGFGPAILARLPEPDEPDDDKVSYTVLAARPHLSLWLGGTAALSAALAATVVEPVAIVPVWVALAAAGALLAYVDWHTRLLPRLIVLPLNAALVALVALAALIEADWAILVRGLISGVVVFALFWLSNFLYSKGLGYGDVRMSFGLGVALGAIGGSEVLIGIYAGFVIGAVCAVLLARLRVVDARGFAFGPYLLAGALVGAVWGPAITRVL